MFGMQRNSQNSQKFQMSDELSPRAVAALKDFNDVLGPLLAGGAGSEQFDVHKRLGKMIAQEFNQDPKIQERIMAHLSKAFDDDDKGTSRCLSEFKEALRSEGMMPESLKAIAKVFKDEDRVVLDLSDKSREDVVELKLSDIGQELQLSLDIVSDKNPSLVQSSDPELMQKYNQQDFDNCARSLAESVGQETLIAVLDNMSDLCIRDFVERSESLNNAPQQVNVLNSFVANEENNNNFVIMRDSQGKVLVFNTGEAELGTGNHIMKLNGNMIDISKGNVRSLGKDKARSKEQEVGGLNLGFGHSF
jgi:hypothetical protein